MTDGRAQMKCRRCGGFSSAQICWHCSNLPDAVTYARIEQLEREIRNLLLSPMDASIAHYRQRAEKAEAALRELVRVENLDSSTGVRFNEWYDAWKAARAIVKE
jgi:UDP-N-acetylmuramoylalanine-D-glutamate ligase